MPIPKLQELERQVEGAIAEKVTERRRELESELSKLARFDGGERGGKVGRGGPRGSVAPKYRNPENPTDTWAGRGLKPRWLVAAIKGGSMAQLSVPHPMTPRPPSEPLKQSTGACRSMRRRMWLLRRLVLARELYGRSGGARVRR
jgi:DNA-binding protein H-NS